MRMKKALSLHTRKPSQKCQTQQPQTYYPQHLIIKKRSMFQKYLTPAAEVIQQKNSNICLQTNFGINVTNQYVYVLLHLRSKNISKNIININIPQICIFYDKMPYDILYSQNGFIRSSKFTTDPATSVAKVRLKDLYQNFKLTWKTKSLPKFQHISAVFKQKQVLLMSQTDFLITCKMIKSDPFFKKLQYIQNKHPYIGQQIIVEYDEIKSKQQQILKLATESLFGFLSQNQIMNQLSEDKYLNFLNQKINLVLNYQHNIRVIKANFHYVKNTKGQYVLVNVTNLKVNNLTKALKIRQEKLKQIQRRRCQILLLTPEKQKRYRSYESPKQVIKYQNAMTDNFQNIVKKMNLFSVTQSKHQQIKNQMAFKKLHPQISTNYKDFISMANFKKAKQKLFGSTLTNRKPISIPSKYVLRSYNKAKRCRTFNIQNAQNIQQNYM